MTEPKPPIGSIEWLEVEANSRIVGSIEPPHEAHPPFPETTPVFAPRVGPAQHVITEDPPDLPQQWEAAYKNLREGFQNALKRARDAELEAAGLRKEVKDLKHEIENYSPSYRRALNQRDVAKVENDRLRKQVETLLAEREEFVKEIEALKGKLANAREEGASRVRDSAIKHWDAADATIEACNNRAYRAENRVAELEKQVETLLAEHQAFWDSKED